MDLEKLAKIKQHVLKTEWVPKEKRDTFCGVFLHSNSPVDYYSWRAVFHSFRAFSEYDYPIIFFVSEDAISEGLYKLIEVYGNTQIEIIPRLNNIFEFNQFCIDRLLFLIPEHYERLVVLQEDGFILKKGFEMATEGYDWLGARWKKSVKVIEDVFGFDPVFIGNGGCNFRRRSKCIEVIKMIQNAGGQQKIVKGIEIDGKKVNDGWFLAEDAFWSTFGFGSGIFKQVDLKWIDSFALEPIDFELAVGPDIPIKPFFFHRCDE